LGGGVDLADEQRYPEPAVSALILSPEGKILLIRSHKWKGKYSIPGGHVELGERMEEALRREVKEETGLDIFDVKFVCFQEFIFDDCFWKKRHFIFFNFACRASSTEVKLNQEAQEYVWVTLDEALRMEDVEPYAKKAIKEFVKKYGLSSLPEGATLKEVDRRECARE
jgi:nucleoside triphosphatase